MSVNSYKTVLSFVLISFFFSCDKDRIPLGLHFQMTVNGKITPVEACGSSTYSAQYLRDTALYISPGCGTSAGFYMKGKIDDGIYDLNESNRAFFSPMDGAGYKSYHTNSTNTGTLILTSIKYENQPALKGVFNYKAIERNTGEVIEVTKGTFLLRKYNY